MSTSERSRRFCSALLACTLSLPSCLLSSQALYAAGPVDALKSLGARVVIHRQTGKVSLIGSDPARPIRVPVTPSPAAQDTALAVVKAYGTLFGLREPATQVRVIQQAVLPDGRFKARYQQLYKNIPVLAGNLVVNLDRDRNLLSMGGEVAPELAIATDPGISADRARELATSAIGRWYDGAVDVAVTGEPQLWIYDPRLVTPSTAPARLVWRLEVSAGGSEPVRELVLVDATNGDIALHFNQIAHAKNRQTYTAGNTTALPGTLVCNESNPSCSGGDTDAVNAHTYAGDTYDFYKNLHGRDSLNNAGLTLTSTVHYDVDYANAFWNGVQMVYGDSLVVDDVVGHELTHGMTQYESNLLYYYQSGAINESLSDVWGEFIDQTNGSGNDSVEAKWLIGEDVPVSIFGGPIRSMKDPTVYQNPDKMTSSFYYTGSADSGGVHTNSGVNNKATFLMTDGGTFNGKTVTGLGINKVAKIYYEVQTNLLTSGSSYSDLNYYLYQGCANLVGTAGITAGDCQQVRNATDAVEMNLEPVAGFEPIAATCPVGRQPGSLFFDDMENSTNWTFTELVGVNAWFFDTGYAASGTKSLYVEDSNSLSDAVAAMNKSVTLPAGAFLHFEHAFGFDARLGAYNDGGVLEYSTNGGSSWSDAGSLFDTGKGYGGTLSSSNGNPLGGRSAFVGDSHGYVASRYNLGSLAGQSVRFRFRQASDALVRGPLGWVVDNVRIYTCSTVGDFNGNDKVDILWRNRTTGANTVWSMNGTSYTSSTAIPTVTDTDWQIVASADFNGDGKADILWRNRSTGQNVVWLMKGTSYVSTVTLTPVTDTNWQVGGAGDASGDGKPDIFWRNQVTGQNILWLMNGTSYASTVTLPVVADTNWSMAASGNADFNGNGKVDILWRNRSTGQNVVWLLKGTSYGSTATLPAVTDTNWQIGGAGDYNGDGKPDILWRNQVTGKNIIWLMNGTSYTSSSSLPSVTDTGWEMRGPR
ncbi:MAG: M4 family metallopeptidase [Gemmatimonadaceae bacterium]|nr:M4 family metallopeptidase [Gloeobacterales cyanobacterium ES-bin-141]